MLVVASAQTGCVHDYHPERRPETTYALQREDEHPVLVLRGSARAIASAVVADAPAQEPRTAPQPVPVPLPAPERGTEHAEGTACDRVLEIDDEHDDADHRPTVSIAPCDPQDTTVIRLVTRSRARGVWILRADGSADAPRERCLEYRLTRRDDGDFCGDVVGAAGCGPARKRVRVCFQRASAAQVQAQVTASAPPQWLAGPWVQQTDGAPCDDGVRVEMDDGALRATEHGCFGLDHFDTSSLRVTLDGDADVELFDRRPTGSTRHVRLVRGDDGSLSGEIAVYGTGPGAGDKPTIKGVRWVRP
jgi:hypothetical protein